MPTPVEHIRRYHADLLVELEELVGDSPFDRREQVVRQKRFAFARDLARRSGRVDRQCVLVLQDALEVASVGAQVQSFDAIPASGTDAGSTHVALLVGLVKEHPHEHGTRVLRERRGDRVEQYGELGRHRHIAGDPAQHLEWGGHDMSSFADPPTATSPKCRDMPQSHKAGVTEFASRYARRKSRCGNTILRLGAHDPACGPGVAFP